MSRDIYMPITIDDIDIPAGRREVNAAAVKKLADSIDQIGLRHPITVREKGDRYVLVAGRHRLEAYKKMEIEHIPAVIVKMTNDEARLWEIAENLHRAELTRLERDEQVAEWIKIKERLSSQVEAKVQKMGRPEGGINAASRELGIDDADAHRAVKVASLSEAAKDAAREVGLDNNRSALLAAAREEEPERQVATITQLATAKIRKPTPLADEPLNDFETTEKQVAALMAAWNKAGREAREQFLGRIDKPIMDRQFA
jgi:ParB family transcriptional regulator, chromosome partitioning protein